MALQGGILAAPAVESVMDLCRTVQQTIDEHDMEYSGRRGPIRVGVLILATGPYFGMYVPNLVRSIQQHFKPGLPCQLEFGIMSDEKRPDVPGCWQSHVDPLPWPAIMNQRYRMILNLATHWQRRLDKYDHLISIDADMLAVADFGAAWLHPLFVTVSPLQLRDDGHPPYERRPESRAAVTMEEEEHATLAGVKYVSGALLGGEREAFLRMIGDCQFGMDQDLARDPPINAELNEESHLNRYCVSHPSEITTLHSGFCSPADTYALENKAIIQTLNHPALNAQKFSSHPIRGTVHVARARTPLPLPVEHRVQGFFQ